DWMRANKGKLSANDYCSIGLVCAMFPGSKHSIDIADQACDALFSNPGKLISIINHEGWTYALAGLQRASGWPQLKGHLTTWAFQPGLDGLPWSKKGALELALGSVSRKWINDVMDYHEEEGSGNVKFDVAMIRLLVECAETVPEGDV